MSTGNEYNQAITTKLCGSDYRGTGCRLAMVQPSCLEVYRGTRCQRAMSTTKLCGSDYRGTGCRRAMSTTKLFRSDTEVQGVNGQ